MGGVEDLVWRIAARAKELANMRMPELRRASSYEGLDLGDGSRGAMIEAVLAEEFAANGENFDEVIDQLDQEF